MSSQIDHLLNEDRRFAPSEDFAANAVAAADLYERAAADREGFWADQARELHWHTPFTKVLDWSNPPFAEWFADGELNVADNCLDRHVEAGTTAASPTLSSPMRSSASRTCWKGSASGTATASPSTCR